MKKTTKRILRVFGGVLGLAIFGAVVFAAFNFTLIKNLLNYRDGALDAMYIANQNPLQIVKGGNGHELKLTPTSEIDFSAAHKNWELTGGKAFLVWHKGELVYETYAEGVSPSARSKSFSMHKSILGLVAATMEADGIIDLEAPVSQYVDAYKNGGRESLTVRNMLQHEAGLERYSFTPPSLDTLNLLLSNKVEKTALKAELVSNERLFDYSNVGYQVAGAALRTALEQEKSQTYAEYLSERLWRPLGANDAFLWSESPDGAPRFYAGLQASPRDWLSVGIMMAQNDGTILPKAAIERVLTPTDLNPGYGLGVWLGSPEDGTREYGPSTDMVVPSALPFTVSDTVYFDGFGGQRVYVSQAEQLVIVRIGDVRFDWDDTALPNLIAKSLALKPSYSDEELTLTGKNKRAVQVRFVSRRHECNECKLAILSHGSFASDNDYDAIVRPLADLGYLVAIPTHPDSKSHTDHESFSAQKYTDYRIEDFQLILQHVADNQGEDTSWVSVGHSFGAMIAAKFAGVSEDENSANASALGLPTHSILLSPPNAIPFAFSSNAFSNLESPTLLITGTNDLVPNMIDDWEDHLDLYNGAPKGKVIAVVFDDQDHYFSGLYGRLTNRNPNQTDEDLINLISSFLTGESLVAGDGHRLLQ